jgi:hypothetical protein
MAAAALSSTIQLATPADGEAIYDFLYPHHFISPDLDRDSFAACWRHQFFSGGAHCVLVARDSDGKLVAHYGLMPLDYMVEGRPMRAGYFCQLFVDPAYRRTPVFFQMERKLLREHREFGFDFLHALIIIPPVLRQHLALGFSRGPEYHTFVFPLAAGSGWRTAWPRVPASAASLLDSISTGVGRAALALRRPAWRGINVIETEAAGVDAAVVERATAGWRMYADRSPRAIAHRTTPFGRKRYTLFAAVAGSRHRGYLTLRCTRVKDFSVAAIIDVVAPDGDDATWSALIAHACRVGLEAGCHAVTAAAPAGTAAARHFQDNLLFRTPSHSTLLYTIPPALAQSMPPLAEWRSGWYDHDYI